MLCFQLCCVIYFSITILSHTECAEYTIAALLSDISLVKTFKRSVTDVSDNGGNVKIKFNSIAHVLSPNILTATNQVCSLFNETDDPIIALILSNPQHSMSTPLTISTSLISSLYSIPTFGISTRRSLPNYKNNHASFIHTVPPYNREGFVWGEILLYFKWREVVAIHSGDSDSEMMIHGMKSVSRDQKFFKITKEIMINTDEEDASFVNDFTSNIEPIANQATRVIVLFLKQKFAEYVFAAARKLGMFEAGWIWLVTEQALQASNIPQGIIGIRLLEASESKHMIDAVRVAASAAIRATHNDSNLMQSIFSKINCDINLLDSSSTEEVFQYRKATEKLHNLMVQTKISDGLTGPIEFNKFGERSNTLYEIINTQHETTGSNRGDKERANQLPSPVGFDRPKTVTVGRYGDPPMNRHQPTPPSRDNYPSALSIDLDKIVWPGNYRRAVKRHPGQGQEETIVYSAPESIAKKKHFRVVTIRSIPFVDYRVKPINGVCNGFASPSNRVRLEIECNHIDTDTHTLTEYCCFGYAIDLLDRMAKVTTRQSTSTLQGSDWSTTLDQSVHSNQSDASQMVGDEGFTYQLQLLSDPRRHEGLVGSIRSSGNYSRSNRQLHDLIGGELLTGGVDMVLTPIETEIEETLFEFTTHPIAHQSVSILVKRDHIKSRLTSFLQPFEISLWVVILLLVPTVGSLLYLIDRFAPPYTSSIKPVESALPPTTRNDGHVVGRENQKQNSPVFVDLASAISFTWSVLLKSASLAVGSRTPKSYAANLFGLVWAGFCAVVLVSYTANLTALLLLSKDQSTRAGIEKLIEEELLHPSSSSSDFTIATVRHSLVDQVVANSPRYSQLHRAMQRRHNYASVEEAVKAVKFGHLKAFIWDSSRLFVEVERDCDGLLEVVDVNDDQLLSSYGLVMVKDDPLINDLSAAISRMHENGEIEELERRWIFAGSVSSRQSECLHDSTWSSSSSPLSLNVSNLASLFVLIAVGFLGAVLLWLAQFAWPTGKLALPTTTTARIEPTSSKQFGTEELSPTSRHNHSDRHPTSHQPMIGDEKSFGSVEVQRNTTTGDTFHSMTATNKPGLVARSVNGRKFESIRQTKC